MTRCEKIVKISLMLKKNVIIGVIISENKDTFAKKIRNSTNKEIFAIGEVKCLKKIKNTIGYV